MVTLKVKNLETTSPVDDKLQKVEANSIDGYL